MTKYSVTNPYELIESAGALDMRGAQLLRAQIDSIDRSNKTASITFLDTCDAVVNLNHDQVPFWYHCEYSSGSLDDLALGHLAFNQDDFVYVLFMPALGEVILRLFIVGHIDIRGTKACGSEYIVIRMSRNGANANEVFSIFDVSALDILDLSTFTNLDVNSPAKPPSFPCSYQTYSAWIAYNFSASTPAYTVPFTITKRPAPDPDTYPDDIEVTNVSSYPTSVDPSYYSLEQRGTLAGTQVWDDKLETRRIGFQGWSSNVVGLASGIYSDGIETHTMSATHAPWGWNLVDGVTSANSAVALSEIASHNAVAQYNVDGSWSYDISSGLRIIMSCVLNDIMDMDVPNSFSKNNYSQYGDQLVGTNLGQFIAYGDSAGVTATFNRSGYCVGKFGFYTFFSITRELSTITAIDIDTDPDWDSGGVTGYSEENVAGQRTTMTLVGTAYSYVVAAGTRFSDLTGISTSNPVSPFLCIQNADDSLSLALATAVKSVLDYSWDTSAHTDVDGTGPFLSAFIKKIG